MPTESTFVLAALFVVAAAMGWAFARWGGQRDKESKAVPISADYLRGLNLVLNRQTDEALELFISMAKVDDDTLETHFALGHLFRRRGEVDRAIRVHQNLLARPNLNETQRHQALFSLAEDYLGAGLFERSEKLFSELVDSPTIATAALENLINIYERESEWMQAIDAHRKLEVLNGEKSSRGGHYYCELAELARAQGDFELARQYLKNSIRSGSGALRGGLIKAAIAQEEGNYAEALRLYEQVIEMDRRFMVEVLGSLVECHKQLGSEHELELYLEGLLKRETSLGQDIAYAAVVGNLTEPTIVSRCIENFIVNNDLLASFINVNGLAAQDALHREQEIARIAGALRRLAVSSARYLCTNCGYSSKGFIWHCPSCKSWETVRPLQTFQFDGLIS